MKFLGLERGLSSFENLPFELFEKILSFMDRRISKNLAYVSKNIQWKYYVIIDKFNRNDLLLIKEKLKTGLGESKNYSKNYKLRGEKIHIFEIFDNITQKKTFVVNMSSKRLMQNIEDIFIKQKLKYKKEKNVISLYPIDIHMAYLNNS